MPILPSLSTAVPLSREVYAFAGQSNSEGRGLLAEMPYLPRTSRVKMFNSGQWTQAEEPVVTGSQVGHALSTGVSLAGLRRNVEVGVVGCGSGGTSMDQWARSLGASSLYGAMLYKIKGSLLKPGTISGFVWYQGESDAMTTEANAEAWAAKFLQMIADLRNDLGAPTLPVVYVTLCDNPGLVDFPWWDEVVASQNSINLTGRNMARVSAAGLPVRTDAPEQAVHLSTAGQITLGEMIATQLATLL